METIFPMLLPSLDSERQKQINWHAIVKVPICLLKQQTYKFATLAKDHFFLELHLQNLTVVPCSLSLLYSIVTPGSKMNRIFWFPQLSIQSKQNKMTSDQNENFFSTTWIQKLSPMCMHVFGLSTNEGIISTNPTFYFFH